MPATTRRTSSVWESRGDATAAGRGRARSRPRCASGGARRPRRRRTRLEVRLLGRGAISPHQVDPLGAPVIPTRRRHRRRVPAARRRRASGWTPRRSSRPTSAPSSCSAATGSGARLGAGRLRHRLRGARRAARPAGGGEGGPGRRAGDPSARSARRWPPARLDHPGIVAVFDAGEDDGARYLVSELVRGRTLDALERDGALSDRDVLRIGLALADALEPRPRARRHPPRRQAAERDRARRARAAAGAAKLPTSASPTWPATSR